MTVDLMNLIVFFFQAEDGIRYLVRSRGLGDVYKRQDYNPATLISSHAMEQVQRYPVLEMENLSCLIPSTCLLYTSDAADERSSVDLGGRRIIKKKKKKDFRECRSSKDNRTMAMKHTYNSQITTKKRNQLMI